MPDFENAKRKAARHVQPADYGKCYHSVLGKEAVAATTAYMLIDMDDPTNFPHHEPAGGVSEIILKSIMLNTNSASNGIYDYWVGVDFNFIQES